MIRQGKFSRFEGNMVVLEYRDGEVVKLPRRNYPDDIEKGDTFYVNNETGEFTINKHKREWDRIYLQTLLDDEIEQK